MSQLDIRLLGNFEMSFGGAPWRFVAPPRCVDLLGYLAVHGGETVSRQALSSTIWPDDTERDARIKLRRHVHELQRALPPSIEPLRTTTKTLTWEGHANAVIDVVQFARAVDDHRYEDAVDLYRGEFLKGRYEPWVLAAREHFAARFLEACFEAAYAARRRRDFETAVVYADRMLAQDEWREDAVRLSMTCRYESGDRSAALALFERFAARLLSEMGVEPMAETRALRSAILANSPLTNQLESFVNAPRILEMTATPFVGRAAELESLSALWNRATKGRGTIVFLGGCAGIGKSRLVSEIAELASSQSGRLLIGGASNPEAYPYEPLVDALRGNIGSIVTSKLGTVWLSSLAGILPELHGALPDLRPPEPLEPSRAKDRLLEALARAVQELAGTKPMLMVLEDAHWAQDATLGFVAALARRIATLPILLIVTYRAEEDVGDRPFSLLHRRLQAERNEVSLVLSPLLAADIHEMVRHGRPAAPPEFSENVFVRSGGNPLFANQLLQSVIETSALSSELTTAQTVEEAIRSLMDGLDKPARALAEAAATIGRSFTVETLALVLGWNEGDVLLALRVLLDRSIVRGAGSGSFFYTFTHALIAETIYAATPMELRIARHRRTADVMAKISNDDHTALATIARHWKCADEHGHAAPAYLRAAAAALQNFAREEAISYAHLAHDLAIDDNLRFDALDIAATAHDSAAEASRWEADLIRLERLAQNLGKDRLFAALRHRQRYALRIADAGMQERAIATLSTLAGESWSPRLAVEADLARSALQAQQGDVRASIDSLSHAIGLADSLDAGTIIEVRQALATVLARAGNLAAARVEIATVRALSRTRGSGPASDLKLLSTEATIASITDDGPSLERIGEEMQQLALQTGDLYMEGKGHFLLGHAAYFRLDYRAVRSSYVLALELWRKIGARDARRAAYFNHAAIELRIGRSDLAISLLALARPEIDERQPGDMYLYESGLSQALLGLGQSAEALAAARRACSASAQAAEPRFVSDALAILSAAEMQSRMFDEAIEHLSEALTLTKAREDWGNATDALCMLIDAFDGANRASEARIYADELRTLIDGEKGEVRSARICAALARFAAATNGSDRRSWLQRGQALATGLLAKLVEPDDNAAFRGLPFIRTLLEPDR